MTTMTVGHTLNLSIAYLDKNGNQMLTAPVPDSIPQWSNSASAVESLAAATDGNSAVATPMAAGSDTISLSLMASGRTFVAKLPVTVDDAPQELAFVGIVATVK